MFGILKKTSTHRLLATLKAKVPWARLAIAAIASSFTHIALIGWEPNALLLACCKHNLRKSMETDTIAKIQISWYTPALTPSLSCLWSCWEQNCHKYMTDWPTTKERKLSFPHFFMFGKHCKFIFYRDHSENPICLSFCVPFIWCFMSVIYPS